MYRAKYREGTGLLIVIKNRLLFLKDTDNSAAKKLEISAIGEDPIRSLAVVVANEEANLTPFIFADLTDELLCIVYGDIQLEVHDKEPFIVDGSNSDFWAYASSSPTSAISYGRDIGSVWVDSGSVRASSFRWYFTDTVSTPAALNDKVSLDTYGSTKHTQAIICFECSTPNPTMTAQCQNCAVFLTEDNSVIQEVAQPVLGTISFSGGSIQPLDKDLLIGRNPDRYGVEPHQRAVVHGVGDNSISRRHLELRREGWQVVLVSLKENSGAIVESRLGRRTVLRFGVPHQLSDGDTVNYGSVWFRYDANISTYDYNTD